MTGLLDSITGGNTYNEAEMNRIRQIRADFNGSINTYQTRALEGKEKGTLSPESANTILTYNAKAQEWLAATPKATIMELEAKKDEYNTDVNNVLSTDVPKAVYRSFYTGLDFLITKYEKDPRFTPKVKKAFENESYILKTWYTENEKTLNKIQLEQKVSDAETRLLQTVEDTPFRNILRGEFAELKRKPAQEWSDLTKKTSKNQEIIKNADFRWSTVWDSFVDKLSYIPLVILCVFGLFTGSLAANSAIHRPALYRVLNFIYGAFPLFVIPVGIYFLIQRVRCGPFPMYGLLPILETTLEKEESYGTLTYLFRSLVTYYPDSTIGLWAEDYQRCIHQYAQ
jgi:hypothetical protein